MLRIFCTCGITLGLVVITAMALIRLHHQTQVSHSQVFYQSRILDLEHRLQEWHTQASHTGQEALAAHATHALRALRSLYHDEARWWEVYLAVEEQFSAQQQYLNEVQAHQQRRAQHQRGLDRLDHLLQQLPDQPLQFSQHPFTAKPMRHEP
ncbi:MAG: hypothetical protein EA401_08015 [Planctomycetota bacterium]|nr:MAG: hypothetical protein EA401_08015 [Planctomycetota bacterium]